MSEYCKQCSEVVFGYDRKDFFELCEDSGWLVVLCEGCGPIQVDRNGECVSVDCDLKHGADK